MAEAEAVVRLAWKLEGQMGLGQKGVVYCRLKKQYEQMAEQLGCVFYHSSIRAYMMSMGKSKGKGEGEERAEPALREERLWQWAEGQSSSRWIAATTGLGIGVDIQGIMAVIYIEQPYRLVDFV